MRVQSTPIEGLVTLEPLIHRDERGFFVETYRRRWHEELGLADGLEFVQDNHSRSTRGVVRGLHLQIGAGVGKLVRCARGRIVDVGVDLRRGSPTYARWHAVELDDESARAIYVPVGFAHGFCALSEVADVIYKQTAYYDPELERAIAWDDPDIAIEWPLEQSELSVSERDGRAPKLREIADELPFEWHP